MQLAIASLRSGNALFAGTLELAEAIDGISSVPFPEQMEVPETNLALVFQLKDRNSGKLLWLESLLRDVLEAG